MIKQINSLLEIDRKHYAATIPPPASAEYLRSCQKELKSKMLPLIPQRYFAFLRNCCNGYNLKVCFYGTKPLRIYNSDHFTEDIVTANERKQSVKYHLFLIGDGWDYNYFYNTKNGLYQTREMHTNQEVHNYKTFAEMFGYESIWG
jgi:hypothetical protein